MIKISNLTISKDDKWCTISVDIDAINIKNPFKSKKIWFTVKKENEWMINNISYDAFILIPTYLGMYYGTDVVIEGNVSKKLYHNLIHYIMPIFLNFSKDLKSINVNVDGFTTNLNQNAKLIGTGISCGIDSLCTIYENYEKEKDESYKINSLFLFNCGTHGDFENERTQKIFEDRLKLNEKAAKDLKLPIYFVNTNLHSFTHLIGEQKMGYLAIYSCILCLQNALKKYYVSSSYSYEEILQFHNQSYDFDMAEHCESYLVPLIQTESLEFILDGSQYKRSEKTKIISDWNIAQNHLNICIDPKNDVKNCSICSKCLRTLFPLDVMGKLDKFDKVFNLEKYYKIRNKNIDNLVWHYGENGFDTDNIDFARKNNFKLPTKFKVFFRKLFRKIMRK